MKSARFDYTQFLSASSSSRSGYLDMLSSLAPALSHLWNQSEQTKCCDQRLWEEALQQLSSTQSDERNLIRLMRLAKNVGINSLEVALPYSFDKTQIEAISEQGRVEIDSSNTEMWKVRL